MRIFLLGIGLVLLAVGVGCLAAAKVQQHARPKRPRIAAISLVAYAAAAIVLTVAAFI